MVLLKLDLTKSVPAEDSIFVSVRIGEQQKLSRLTNTRTYRFPKSGDKHYGKIEVFQRIGSGYVDVDPSNKFEREVCINAGEQGELGFKIAVEDNEGRVARNAAAAAKAAESDDDHASSKSKAAKEYLQKHGLEARLSEAMQALLREKPEEPAAFLASILLGSVSPKAKENMLFTAGALTLGNNKSTPKGASRSSSPVKPKTPKARPAVSSLKPFAKYYSTNLLTSAPHVPSASASLKLFNKFPGFRKAAEVVATAAASAAAPPMFNDTWQQYVCKPSVGTWILRKPKASPQPEEEKTQPKKKDFFLRPSVGTWLAKPSPKKPPAEKPKKMIAMNLTLYGSGYMKSGMPAGFRLI